LEIPIKAKSLKEICKLTRTSVTAQVRWPHHGNKGVEMSETIDNADRTQESTKRNSIKIDPALQAAMDPYISIDRATFANGADEQALANTVLLTFSGMGLAKAVRGNHGSMWVRTEQLKELERMQTAPLDLSPFMVRSDDGNVQPQMTESLRLILADIIRIGQRNRPEIAHNITVDSTLLDFELNPIDPNTCCALSKIA
jgi:hypothetical protein